MRWVFVLAAAVVSLGACGPSETVREPANGRTALGGAGGATGVGGKAGVGGTAGSHSGASGGASGGAGGQLSGWCSFAPEIAFTLPSGFAIDQLDDPVDDSGATCVQGELSYGLRDMDGDETLDLVVTDRCDHDTVGTTHWLVYLNDVTRFTSPPLTWPLPAGFATDQLDDLETDSGSTCTQGQLSYATRDIDGDRRADLVISDRCDHAGVGTTSWEVYLNTGSGFAPAISWSLPTGYVNDQLDDVNKDTSSFCGVGQFASSLVDMDGDRRPELVVTDRCDLGAVGTSHWLVYANLGTGFNNVATTWTLPGGFGTDGLRTVGRDTGGLCAHGQLSFGLRDLDGDFRPDLVITDNCDHADVGTTRWLTFINLGNAFGPAADWPLPTADFGTDQLDDLADHDAGTCGVGMFGAFAIDINGDNAVELVVTDDCDHTGVGHDHWRTYENTTSNFAGPTAWALPADFGFDPFDRLQRDDGGGCVQGELSTLAIDITGDRVLDLVVTDDCDHAEVGTTHWRVFPGTCDP